MLTKSPIYSPLLSPPEELNQALVPRWEVLNSDFQFDAKHTGTSFEVTFFSEGKELIANVMERSSSAEALQLFLQFARKLFAENSEQEYLATYEAAFYDGESFFFLKPLMPVPQKKVGVLKGFIYGMSMSVANIDDSLKHRLLEACDTAQNADIFESIIYPPANETEQAEQIPVMEQIKVCPSCGREYELKANFCPCCGVQLIVEEFAADDTSVMPTDENATIPAFVVPAEPEPEQEAPAFVVPAEPEPVEDFDNGGATTVLGGGTVSSNTPNLVRKSNNEKVFITKDSFVIGKNPNIVDYAIAGNNAISRCHAAINTIGTNYYVIDQNSTNHTFVNGKMIPERTSVQLNDGDVISLSNEVFVFRKELF